MMACEHAKVPYGILPERSITADMLRDCDAVLLPEVYTVTPALAEALQRYVQDGGRLVVSGRSGTLDEGGGPAPSNSLSALTGVRYIREHNEYATNRWSAYLKACRPEDFKGLAGVSTPPVSEFFVEVRPESAGCLAEFVLPAVACTPTEWVNWWCPPPGEMSGMPAITLNRVGKGQVIYLAFDFFTMEATEEFRDTNALFTDLLHLLRVETVLKNETDIPGILRTAFFEEDDCYQIHQVSTIPNRYQGEVCPVAGGAVVSRVPVASARLVYPAERKLPVIEEQGTWRVEVPAFTIQQMIILEKQC